MNVILLDKIRNLGSLGDEVSVKAGYARNYLLPYGKAVVANEANRAKFEAERTELEKTQAEHLESARSRGEAMAGVTVQIVAKAGEEGKLFGSVGAREIVEALAASGFEAQRSEVLLPDGPLKEIGDHDVQLSLHPEVTVDIKVSIVAE
ncbi:MAG: 50S ribosomal protein L9 [Acidiferrobacteraceae bacterium]|jgi:large subunit ribosomal protein L9